MISKATRGRSQAAFASGQPTVDQIVAHLNRNAERAQGVLCQNIDLTVRRGALILPMDGKLAFEKPRNFRLTVNAASVPVADIGSNDQEFWAYFRDGDQPALVHASYDEYRRGRQEIPIHPEWVLDSFGLTPIDDTQRATMVPRERGLAEVRTPATTPQGQPATRVTVVDTRSGSIAEQHLEVGGTRIASAYLSDHFRDAVHGVELPGTIRIAWPQENVNIKVQLRENAVVVNPEIDPAWAVRLWTIPPNLLQFESAQRELEPADDRSIRR